MTFKKIIIGFMFLAIVLATFLGSLIAILVSNYQIPQVALFRNTELHDNSFNQQAYDGMNEYGELTDNSVSEAEISPSISIGNVTANKLFSNGTQTIIANSYMYFDWVLQYEKQLKVAPDGASDLKENQYIIYVDDSDEAFVDSNQKVKRELTDEKENHQNIISMAYHAEEATFMAGLISCMYVVTQYPNNPEEWTLGIWGGMDYSAVNAIMSGYEAGIQFFNEYVLGWNNDTSNIDNTVKLINHQGNTNYETAKKANKKERTYWYSGSYYVDQTGKTQALGLIANGAKVITPVAGAQTVNAINEAEIANNNSDDEVKVVGMDVDGKKQFPNNKDVFLTSAIKNIEDTLFINLLEIEAKNNPEEAAEIINNNDNFKNSLPESYEDTITSKQVLGAPFQEVWGYESKIPDPNSLSSEETLHGVGVSNPEENQGLYEDFQKWTKISGYVDGGISSEINEFKTITKFLEFALDKVISSKKYGAIPNNSVSFTNNGIGESYYEWQ